MHVTFNESRKQDIAVNLHSLSWFFYSFN